MQLIDFSQFEPFNALRHKMRATLENNFSFDNGTTLLSESELSQLHTTGIKVTNDELSFYDDGTITYKNQRVILHIRDVHQYRENLNLPKFHISDCITLDTMWKKNRSERYVVSHNETGFFLLQIIIDSNIETKNTKLKVCQNCLKKLKWKNFSSKNINKNDIVEKFSIKEFFKVYPKSIISYKPKHKTDTAPLNNYSKDWHDISSKMKAKHNYTCQKCNTIIPPDKSYQSHCIQVHHKDGQKNNNSLKNLEVLCYNCHSKEAYHSHMKPLM